MGLGAREGGGGVWAGERPWYGDPELEELDDEVNITGDIFDPGGFDASGILSCKDGPGYSNDSDGG